MGVKPVDVLPFSEGKRETQKQYSQEMSGKCLDDNPGQSGIMPGLSRENFVYAFSCLSFSGPHSKKSLHKQFYQEACPGTVLWCFNEVSTGTVFRQTLITGKRELAYQYQVPLNILWLKKSPVRMILLILPGKSYGPEGSIILKKMSFQENPVDQRGQNIL